jgi:hypothetical protein
MTFDGKLLTGGQPLLAAAGLDTAAAFLAGLGHNDHMTEHKHT